MNGLDMPSAIDIHRSPVLFWGEKEEGWIWAGSGREGLRGENFSSKTGNCSKDMREGYINKNLCFTLDDQLYLLLEVGRLVSVLSFLKPSSLSCCPQHCTITMLPHCNLIQKIFKYLCISY